MQSKLIGMAMSEAAKLFESQGASGGNKQVRIASYLRRIVSDLNVYLLYL